MHEQSVGLKSAATILAFDQLQFGCLPGGLVHGVHVIGAVARHHLTSVGLDRRGPPQVLGQFTIFYFPFFFKQILMFEIDLKKNKLKKNLPKHCGS